MDKVNIAYDIDGVLSIMCKRDKPYSKQNKFERENFEKGRVRMYGNSPLLMRPKESFYIISGRKEKYRMISDEWLKKNNLKVIKSFYLTGKKTFDDISKFKISKLKELNIDRYYEDDPKLIREIKKALPNLEIIHIPRNEKNVKLLKTNGLQQQKIF